MRIVPSLRTSLNVLLVLLAFVILWKGGKSLESTWLMTGAACLVVLAAWNSRPAEPWKLGVSATLWWSCLLFILWTAVTYVLSTTRNYGLDEVLREGSLFLLLPVLARVLPGDAGRAWTDRFLRVMTWVTLVACAIGIAVYVLQPVNRMVGTFFDHRFHTDYWPNAWAEFLLLAWPVAALWAMEEGAARRGLRLMVLGVLFGCLLLSYSRGALLAFLGQLFCLALIQGARVHRGWRGGGAGPLLRQLGLRAAVPIVLAGITFAAANLARSQVFSVQSVVEKVTFTAAEGASSKSERAQFWRQAAILTRGRPITGYGPYSFRFTQPALQEGVLQTSDHPHNVFLKLGAERGVPAVILFLVILGSILAPALIRQFAPDRLRQPGLQPDTAFLIAVLGVIAHLMIDYNLQFIGIILPFVILLALLASGDRREARTSSLARRVGYAEVTFACVLLITAVWEGRFLVLSSLGRRAEAQGDSLVALAWYQASAGEWFSRDLLLSQARLLMDLRDWSQAEEVLNRYDQENSQDYRSLKLLAELALLRGEAAEARDLLSLALRRALWNDLSVLRHLLELQADARDSTGNLPPEAVMTALRAYHAAILQNAHFIGLSQNAEEFLHAADRAALLWPAHAAELDELTEEVTQKARSLRQEIAARRPGFLW